MITERDLQETLRNLGLGDISVNVEGRPGHLVAIVSSPEFNELDEAIRQRRVWEHLIQKFSDEDRIGIEYVFTFTPKELAEINTESGREKSTG